MTMNPRLEELRRVGGAGGELITLDGAMGEGGGQVLRSSLSLSAVTGRPFKLERVRAARRKPGLMRQHLTAVRAAAEICGAQVDGAALGSDTVTFRPGRIRAGDYAFHVGTAGSAALVLQTVIPALALADEASTVVVEGGTHVPMAPTVDFLDLSYGRALRAMGVGLHVELERPGFYPAGGGRVRVRVEPASGLTPLELLERGAHEGRHARVLVGGGLPERVARSELRRVTSRLTWPEDATEIEVRESLSPGNALALILRYAHVTAVFTALGAVGKPGMRVADEAIDATRRYLLAQAPVGEHLADQLLVPLALAGGGRLRTLRPTAHTRTNAAVVERFLPVRVTLTERRDAPRDADTHDDWELIVAPSAGG